MELQVSQAAAAALDYFRGVQSLSLAKGALWKPKAHEEVEVVRVLEGRVWLTAEGCKEDFVLEAGDEMMTSGLKTLLFESIEKSVIELVVGL